MLNNQIATMNVLYSEHPQQSNDQFIEIRQWETVDGEAMELIVEFGRLNAAGELSTQCQIMLFHLSVREILVEVNG